MTPIEFSDIVIASVLTAITFTISMAVLYVFVKIDQYLSK